MPKSSLDWLGVVCAWIGSIILAIKTAGAPLVTGAPDILASHFWGYAPVILLSIALAIFIYRLLHPYAMEPPVVQGQFDAPPVYNDRRADLSNTTMEIFNARRVARNTIGDRTGNLPAAVARLESALISTAKTFGVVTPASLADDRATLKIWLEYYDAVAPFLQSGNYDAAKAKAAKFITDRGLNTSEG